MTTTTSATSSTSTSTATAAATAAAASNSSLGSSILSSLGAGADIDTTSIVSALTAAKKASLEGSITTKQTSNTAQISSLATLSSDVTTFSSSLQALITGGTLQTQPTSSDTSILSVSALSGAAVGALSDQIEVDQLAQAQTIESQDVASTATLGTGTLTLTTASNPNGVPITIDSSNNSVSGIASAINAANAGLTASVVTDANGSRLVVKGSTGAAQSFSITSSDSSLAQFTYTPPAATDTSTSTASASGMGRDLAAQDAAIKLDGVSITRSSNTFSDVISGVTINLAAAKPGTIVNIGATRPTTAITNAVNDFVSVYNQLLGDINTATAGATATTSAGPLRGNQTIRDMQRQLAQLTTTPLTASGSITTLAQIGVSTNQDGTLSVDSTALSNALTNYPDDVEALFNTTQKSSVSGVGIGNTPGAVASGVYSLTNLVPSSGATAASGNINGVAATGKGTILTAASGSGAAGLILVLSGSAPSNATVTINQGLGGALQAISDALTGSSGTITTLSANLTSQNTTLATQLATAETQLTNYTTLITNQFTTMNTRVSAIKASESYLTQQVALWDKSS
ncbi:MAG TPA: flagellar filament capping protein FliD [Sphingomonas sp.]